ncbi:MAG: hypothetical protein LBH40_00145 [Alphaproteobacteria bacterium]|jgi:hypothetical protein|nr:hypothetical protein [Alphaproteobacteria bacterium]
MLILRIIVLFLLSTSFLQAKYLKCFLFQNDKIDYSQSIALFLEEGYISVMDNVYHVNAEFASQGKDSQGEFYIYKKEAEDFLYQAKVYKETLTVVLIRKNLIDNKMFPDTTYKCQNPDTMKPIDGDVPIIITPEKHSDKSNDETND